MKTVEFPNLGLYFEFNPWAISIFGVEIAWYAILITIGFIVASIYLLKRLPLFGLDADPVLDVVLGGMIGGIVGARAYFVFFSWDYFKDRPEDILNLRLGGLAFYGGVIGSVLITILLCKLRQVKIRPMLDIAGLGFLIGQGIGRWGNFVNVEAYGSQTSSSYLLGMGSNSFEGNQGLVHPCFLYESIWCFIGFGLLHRYTKKRKFDGELALLYLAWNGIGRVVIEGLRTDSLMLGNIRISQFLAGTMVIVSLIVIVMVRYQIKNKGNGKKSLLYVDTQECKEWMELVTWRKKDPQIYREKLHQFKHRNHEKREEKHDELETMPLHLEESFSETTIQELNTEREDD